MANFIFSKKLNKYSNILQGIAISDILLDFNTPDVSNRNIKDRIEYVKLYNINPNNVVLLDQGHTNRVAIVTKKDAGKGLFDPSLAIKNYDGLITNSNNIFLGVYSADCVPISLYDPRADVVGIAHSGWKGTYKNIVHEILKIFINKYGSMPEDIIAYLGPAIGPCCYDVSQAEDDRIMKFRNEFVGRVILERGNKIYIDLRRAIELELQKDGVLKDNIENSMICTCCSKKYCLPSYYRKREKKRVGSMLTLIGKRKAVN